MIQYRLLIVRPATRYIVDDVDAAVAFYTAHLGFSVAAKSGADFA